MGPCKAMAVSQAFIFHFKCYSLLHFAVCQLIGWAFLFLLYCQMLQFVAYRDFLVFIYLFIYYWIYRPPTRANTSERSAGSRVLYFASFSDFQLRLRSSVCYRTSSLQPKYQTKGVNYIRLYDMGVRLVTYSLFLIPY